MSEETPRIAIASLSDGDLIRVTWDGGNGPHIYRVRLINGVPWAYLTDEDVPVSPLLEVYLGSISRA